MRIDDRTLRDPQHDNVGERVFAGAADRRTDPDLALADGLAAFDCDWLAAIRARERNGPVVARQGSRAITHRAIVAAKTGSAGIRETAEIAGLFSPGCGGSRVLCELDRLAADHSTALNRPFDLADGAFG